jgi:hypothetical protein
VALNAVMDYLQTNDFFEEIMFVCFSENDKFIFAEVYSEYSYTD